MIRRFFDPVIHTKRLSFGSFVIAIFRGWTTLVWPYLISQLIIWIEQKSESEFIYYLKLYALLSFVIRLVNFFISRVWRRYHFDEMRTKVYKDELHAYTLLSNNETEKIGTGKANSIIQKWADKRIDMINDVFVNFFQSGFVLISILIWVFVSLWSKAFMLFFIVWGLFIWVSLYGNSMLKNERADRKEYVTEADRRIVRFVMSKFEMLLSWKFLSELSIIDTIFTKLKSFWRRIAIKQILAIDVVYVATVLVMTYWLWYSGNEIIAGNMFFGEFTLWRMLFGRMRGNIESTLYGLTSRFDNWTHVEKLRDFHDNPNKIHWYEEWVEFRYAVWEVEIRDLSFAYDESTEAEVFSDFSLRIKGKKKTALVWLSWSGKSTLVKLIAWYLRPSKWSIMIDKQDLASVSLKSYYQNIWYLTQDPSVFDWTLLDNLTYAVDGEVNKDELEKCIRLAKCEFVYGFPQGLKTEIGERGVRLSGGQRQRLAIAKIFLKDPEIIILDEPTSALDSFSEESITQAMQNLFEDRTVIIIAHRLQTVKNADDIIVIDAWKVVERGTHDELIAQWWSYAKMLELQSGF